MTTTTIKKNIHKMVDMINDVNYLKSVQNILSEKAIAESFVLSTSEIKLLEKRSAEYKKNRGTLKTWNEVKEGIVSKYK